jgi:hypothetical protein
MPIIGSPEPVADFDNAEIGQMFFSSCHGRKSPGIPNMDGQAVFKKAVVKISGSDHGSINCQWMFSC